jgi:hypothetical protein
VRAMHPSRPRSGRGGKAARNMSFNLQPASAATYQPMANEDRQTLSMGLQASML